ncbi:MAG: 1-acyl-sn-glycerol-3-phosphate acyltransferase [Spirochaetales bacterium]|nr:1-acyl-sn-glycerol-3-phosphate acyltransferase [Spirochaetales bacterium]
MADQKSSQSDIRVIPGFFTFARHTYGRILRFLYKMTISKSEGLTRLEPPYIILANHVNTFDPILISVMYDKPIQWVAGDTLFRNPVLGYLLRKLVGSISKSKSRSDYHTIKQITQIIRKNKGIVGLFPEGQRTWDGISLPLYYSTAKLVRMLKVPVVICILEGGYQTLPRWSNRRRPGKLVLSFKEPIMPETYAGKSNDEIYSLLTDALNFDAHEFQRTHKIRFKGRRRAEYLEHVLYICPSCGSVVSMVSDKNNLTCRHCKLDVHMDEYGFLSSEKEGFSFTTVAEWNSWQLNEIEKRIRSGYWNNGKPIFIGDTALFGSGYREQQLAYFGEADVIMDINGLTVVQNDKIFKFSYDKLESVSVAFQRVFEFYYENTLYRLKFPPPRSSAYKYLSMYECIQEVLIGNTSDPNPGIIAENA